MEGRFACLCMWVWVCERMCVCVGTCLPVCFLVVFACVHAFCVPVGVCEVECTTV